MESFTKQKKLNSNNLQHNRNIVQKSYCGEAQCLRDREAKQVAAVSFCLVLFVTMLTIGNFVANNIKITRETTKMKENKKETHNVFCWLWTEASGKMFLLA